MVSARVVDLSVTKTLDDPTPDEGQAITYTLVARNSASSNATATGVVVIDDLPAGLTFVSSAPAKEPTIRPRIPGRG